MNPPATKSPLGSTVKAVTSRSIPPPIADHSLPFHRAMLLTATPPADVNHPPTTKSPFGSFAIAYTSPFTPGSDHPIALTHCECPRGDIIATMHTTSRKNVLIVPPGDAWRHSPAAFAANLSLRGRGLAGLTRDSRASRTG